MDCKLCLFFIAIIPFVCAKELWNGEFVNQINQENLSWKAKEYSRFSNMTTEEVKQLLGFEVDSDMREKFGSFFHFSNDITADIPTSFDSRNQWPTCIHPVLNQGDCGSCWAFGATESLTDRFCIQSNSTMNQTLSVEQLVSCNDGGLEACNGGDPFTAFVYTSVFGLPLDSCFPYTAGANGTTPPCRDSCVDSNQPFQLYYSDLESIYWHYDISAIQSDIFSNGPVEACFEVYSDFISYSSGVYVYSSGDSLGGHCIKLIGWGHDSTSNLDYWIAQNSWGSDWGMNGYFYIERGVDMCGIEDEVWSVLADV